MINYLSAKAPCAAAAMHHFLCAALVQCTSSHVGNQRQEVELMQHVWCRSSRPNPERLPGFHPFSRLSGPPATKCRSEPAASADKEISSSLFKLMKDLESFKNILCAVLNNEFFFFFWNIEWFNFSFRVLFDCFFVCVMNQLFIYLFPINACLCERCA